MVEFRQAAQSDPLSPEAQSHWQQAVAVLAAEGWTLGRPAQGPELWSDPLWRLVADPTGGSRCQETLAQLMADLPEHHVSEGRRHRAWWSMSDNCQVLNALVDRGLCRVFHGHPLTLAGRDSARQLARFRLWSACLTTGGPFPAEALPPLVPLAGAWPSSGSLIGGNLTALERLGTTPWRPRPSGRLLLVESLSAPASEAGRRVAALAQDPWWEDIGGLVLGRFTAADRSDPSWVQGCLSLLPPEIPVARWPSVGHGADGWTVPLGEPLTFSLA